MDDLGFSLLLLSSARTVSGAGGGGVVGTVGAASALPGTMLPLSPAVLQAVLSVFVALLNTVGPCMRILVECFMRQVYLKALVQTYNLFSEQVHLLGDGVDVISPFFSLPAGGTSAPTAAQPSASASEDSNFRIDELEVIFESLSDILSDSALLPSLFVSFDCNPTSIDLVQPIVQYICRCCW